MSERAGRLALGAIVVALLAGAARTDVSEVSESRFWSDTATYYTATWSLVEDRDLRYEARDLLRVQRRYGSNPEGIFLKRAFGGLAWTDGFPWLRRIGEDEPRIYFAKAFVHPVFAAPFVAVLGNRGFSVLNAGALALCLVLGYAELRRRTTPGRALAVTCVLFLGTITPLYLLWTMPELLNVALLAAALAAWRNDRPILSAVLFGIATYSKPSNVLVALPLGVAPLLVERAALLTGVLETLRRGVGLFGAIGLLYGVNLAVTGEWNYQGGRERKTFHGRMPFDEHGNTFGNCGTWMTTNQVGPIVEGRNEDLVTRQTGPARARGEIRESFLWNLLYFWVGRFGGAVPYFLPVAIAGLAFLLLGPRERAGWLALAGLLVSYVAYIWVIPDNWYGGGGTVGNRYFLNLVPLALFFVPRGREWWVAGGGLLGTLVLVGPILAAPMTHTLNPGLHARRAVFRAFPLELTMLNDLAVFTELWRKKQSVGDTEGDPYKRWRAEPTAYYLYFPDDGTCVGDAPPSSETCGRHERDGRVGFRLAPGRSTEVVLRALEPVRSMRFRLEAGAAGDEIELRVPGGKARRLLASGEAAEVEIAPAAGFGYYDTFLYVLDLRSVRAPAPGARSSFVSVALEVDARPPPEERRGR